MSNAADNKEQQYQEFISVVREFTIDGADTMRYLTEMAKTDKATADHVYFDIIRPLTMAHARLARWTGDQLGFDAEKAVEDALAD